MNVEYLERFIREIEELGKANDDSFLEMIVSYANNFIIHGEYKIALDNTLDNLYEESIFLDEEIISLARQAYGKKITLEQEANLKLLTNKL
jgi:hypothetical protein